VLSALSLPSSFYFFFSCNRLVFLPAPLKAKKSIWAAEFVFLLVMLEEKRTRLAFELPYSFHKTNSLLK